MSAELMVVVGYARFGAAGGDIGSLVCRYLALDQPRSHALLTHEGRTRAASCRLTWSEQ
jgi:hypothetical protein